jgi:signal transduction histidine kinase
VRTKLHIATVILICSLGGLALALGLARALGDIEEDVRELGPDSVALKNVSHLQTLMGQWLLSCDLVLSGAGGTYLHEGARQQADEAATLLEDLAHLRLGATEAARLGAIERRIRRVEQLVHEAAFTSGPDLQGQLDHYVELVDQESVPLIAEISTLAMTLEERAAASIATVEGRRARLGVIGWVAGGLYTAMVIGVWRWTTLKLVRPLQALTRAADRVSRGDLTVDVPVTSSDEMGDLIRTFDHMVHSLRRSNEEIERNHQNLEATIAERTAALRATTNQARYLAERAEQASAAKSAFLANMSHELRTPLHAIIGYSEMLIEDGDGRHDGSTVEDLRRITKAGRHLLSLITSILELSKIEAGRLEVTIEPFDAGTLVASAVDIGQMLARDHQNTFTASGLEALGTMRSDRTKLRQVLLNLVGNACKFNTNCHIEIRCRRDGAEPDAWLEFQVRDEGVGIGVEDVKRLFEDFVQVDASTTRRHGGTGLGLAISRRLTELLGGTLTVESTLGTGSTFTVRVPADAPVGRVESDAMALVCSSSRLPTLSPLGTRAGIVRSKSGSFSASRNARRSRCPRPRKATVDNLRVARQP